MPGLCCLPLFLCRRAATPPHPRPSPAVLTGRFSLTAVTDPLYRPTAHVDEPAEEFADTPISDTELNDVYADAVRHGDTVRPGRTRRGSRPTRRALVLGPLGLQPALALARDWLLVAYTSVRDFGRVVAAVSARALVVVTNERDDCLVRLGALAAIVAIILRYSDIVALVVTQAGGVSSMDVRSR